MSLPVLYCEEGKVLKVERDHDSIVKTLEDLCIIFQRWQVKNLPEDASEEVVLKAYEREIESIKSFYKFVSLDVASIIPDHSKRIRNMFLKEHTHSDFEVRFFVDGIDTLKISDIAYLFEELNAANSVSMHTVRLVRDGEAFSKQTIVEDFYSIEI